MTLRPSDPLLAAVRVMTGIAMALAALVALATLLGAPAALVAGDALSAAIASETGHPTPAGAIPAIALLLAFIGAMATCAFLFLRLLRRLIDSVGQGDPFIPVNADRLARMGWLTLGIEVLSVPAGGIGEWLAGQFHDATSDFGISMSGILLALVLFVLARVFRLGAAMREDLEGTV
ncbi:DUF2975 domain-containing protein [Novosphingobium lubricantis]|jgi:hypothetical protein